MSVASRLLSLGVVDWSELSLQLVLTFGHFLWQACVVAVLLEMALGLLSLWYGRIGARGTPGTRTARSDASLRYLAACGAYFALPVCVLGTLAWVHQSRGPVLLSVTAAAADTRESRPSAADSDQSSSQPSGIAATDAQANFRTSNETFGSQSAGGPPAVGSPVPKEVDAASVSAWSERLRPFAPSLLMGYLVGAGLLLSRFGFALVGSARLRRRVGIVRDLRLLAVVAAQAERIGLRRPPLLALCSQVTGPVVMGVLKPVILLPTALISGLGTDQLAAVVCHELAHIRRHDLLVNSLQRVVEALLFFHPVTWWISRHVSGEREDCCDDLAASVTGSLPYADALLHMAEVCLPHNSSEAAALASLAASGHNTSQLGRRIRRLIGARHVPLSWSRQIGGVAVALSVVAGVTLTAWAYQAKPQPAMTDEDNRPPSLVSRPQPTWSTSITEEQTPFEQPFVSPVVLAQDRLLAIQRDYRLANGTPQRTLPQRPAPDPHGQQVTPVLRRRSSDGRFIVEVSHRDPGATWSLPSSDVRVLRTSDGTQVGQTVHAAGVMGAGRVAVDVESGGRFLLLATAQGQVDVIRVETGEVETRMPLELKSVDATAFCPDRDHIVVSANNTLYVWPWRDQRPVRTLDVGRTVLTLAFTPDGQYLAAGPDSRQDIRIRDMRTLQVVATLQDKDDWPMTVSSMDVTADGRFLVATNRLQDVRIQPGKIARLNVWDLQTRGKPVFTVSTDAQPRYVAFSDDAQRLVAEFVGREDGRWLAAWDLPQPIMRRGVPAAAAAPDRLGDGIQWSRWGDKDGLLSGARLLLPRDSVQAGEPLVVEYRLANVSDEVRTLNWLPNRQMRLTTLRAGNVIGGFGIGHERQAQLLTLQPGEVFINSDRTVQIDTAGLPAGKYRASLGAAFFYPDEQNDSVTHSIPHRGQLPFQLTGPPVTRVELPDDTIFWGAPVAGLALGARWSADQDRYASGDIVHADLFVANASNQPIRCSVELPHYEDGWLFNVEDSHGTTVMLERGLRTSIPGLLSYVPLQLDPGESVALTGPQRLSRSRRNADDLYESTLPPARFLINAQNDTLFPYGPGNAGPCPQLASTGGRYQSIFEVTLHRPDIPGVRIRAASAGVPFVVSADERAATSGTTVAGRVRDPDGQPVVGADISCLPYAGSEKVEAVYTKTDAEGRFEATFSRRDFRVHIGSPHRTLDGCGFRVKNGRAESTSEAVKNQSTDARNFVVATLPRAYQMTVSLVDDQTGQPLRNGAVLFKEDESTWFGGEESHYENAKFSVFLSIRDGNTKYARQPGAAMGLAHLRAIATGYEIAKYKGNALLERGQPANLTIRMKGRLPTPLKVLQADGSPAAGATLSAYPPEALIDAYEFRRSAPLRQMHSVTHTTDRAGLITLPYPAFGPWARYRILHPSGHAEFRPEDVAAADSHAVATEHELRLIARADIQGRLLPQIREHEFLEVYRLQPNRQSVDGEAEIVDLAADGSFHLPGRLAGWHTFVHRIRVKHDGHSGTRAIAGYGPFQLQGGDSRTVTLGQTGRSVVGQLELPADATFPLSGLQIYTHRDGPYRYPHVPHGLNEDQRLAWWDQYWESDWARDNQAYLKRNITVPVAADGRFHFPLLPAGTYELRLNHQYWKGERLRLVHSPLVVPETDSGTILDVGKLPIGSVPSVDSHRHSPHDDHDHHGPQEHVPQP